MKMNFYFIWSCFAILCLAMLMVSCLKEVETTEVLTPNVSLESSERNCVSGCNECPVEFCCCRIEIINPQNASIDICGNLFRCQSMDSCMVSATGNCPEIIGIIENVDLQSGFSPYFYCHEKDGAIQITNNESQGIFIRVTCMVNDITTMFTNVFIPAFGSQTVFVDDDCEPEVCN